MTPMPCDSNAAQGGAELQALRECSARLGAEPALIQAGGGNTSIKDGDRLWVKSSGRWLANALRVQMFVPVSLAGVRRRIAAKDADPVGPEVQAELNTAGLRPSIETTLHALLPHAAVLHVHSVDALAWLVREDAQTRIAERLYGLRWLWVPYVRPGLVLAQVLAEALAREPADVIMMGNHGLVVGGDTVAAAETLLHDVVSRLALPTAQQAPSPDLERLERIAAQGPYTLPADAACHSLATDARCTTLAAGGALYPDHVVFLGGGLPVITDELPPDFASPALLVAGAGVLVHQSLDAAGQAMLRCLADVLARIEPEARVRYLPDTEVQALVNWDAEKFRRRQGGG